MLVAHWSVAYCSGVTGDGGISVEIPHLTSTSDLERQRDVPWADSCRLIHQPSHRKRRQLTPAYPLFSFFSLSFFLCFFYANWVQKKWVTFRPWSATARSISSGASWKIIVSFLNKIDLILFGCTALFCRRSWSYAERRVLSLFLFDFRCRSVELRHDFLEISAVFLSCFLSRSKPVKKTLINERESFRWCVRV